MRTAWIEFTPRKWIAFPKLRMIRRNCFLINFYNPNKPFRKSCVDVVGNAEEEAHNFFQHNIKPTTKRRRAKKKSRFRWKRAFLWKRRNSGVLKSFFIKKRRKCVGNSDVVGEARFELAANGLKGHCSTAELLTRRSWSTML